MSNGQEKAISCRRDRDTSHKTIATDPGLARTWYELGGGSFSWKATLEPIGELTTDSVNSLILQSTGVWM